jgi:hypothetical protein
MSNVYGRQVVVALTNKSGGAVIAGDVVVVGTANNDAFTTTASAGFTGTVGVAQETIADNATGRVLISGYAALVNTTASVTRQNFGTTSTTVKKAVDAGASRTVGTFCQFLTGGTTPDAIVYPADLGSASGSMATDALWDAAGDLAVGTGANTAAKLTMGAAGGVVSRVNGAVAWNSGTSFPTAATGDRYWRTDIMGGLECFYDGTRWLSCNMYSLTSQVIITVTASTNVGRFPVPWQGVYGVWVVSFDWFFNLDGTAHSGTNYYQCLINWADNADADTQIGSTIDSTTATTINNNYNRRSDVGAVLNTGAREIKFRVTKVSAGADMVYCTGLIHYRLILT